MQRLSPKAFPGKQHDGPMEIAAYHRHPQLRALDASDAMIIDEDRRICRKAGGEAGAYYSRRFDGSGDTLSCRRFGEHNQYTLYPLADDNEHLFFHPREPKVSSLTDQERINFECGEDGELSTQCEDVHEIRFFIIEFLPCHIKLFQVFPGKRDNW